MLSNGSDLSTVDNLSIEDAKALYVGLQTGLWGPYGEAQKTYVLYCSQHLQKEVTVAVASGKKYKPTPVREFHEVFPTYEDFLTLGNGESIRKSKEEHSLAISLLTTLPNEGAPAWLKEML